MLKQLYSKVRALGREVCPPLVVRALRATEKAMFNGNHVTQVAAPERQQLDVYWDPAMAQMWETWGEGNAWNEIQLLVANCRGKVLDIACGTGKVISLLAKFPGLEVHGFDISDFF